MEIIALITHYYKGIKKRNYFKLRKHNEEFIWAVIFPGYFMPELNYIFFTKQESNDLVITNPKGMTWKTWYIPFEEWHLSKLAIRYNKYHGNFCESNK